MVKELIHDPIFLAGRSSTATKDDLQVAKDLLETLLSYKETCVGMAASMGAVLLSCGEKGNRYVLPHSRVMIHQVSSGMRGVLSDMRIELEQTERCEQDIYKILADNTNKSVEEIRTLCDRDNWFIGQEAVDLGIADKVLTKK